MSSITAYRYDPNNFYRYVKNETVYNDVNQLPTIYYPIPGNCTTVAPTDTEDSTHKNLFNPATNLWTLTEWHVGSTVYSTTTPFPSSIVNYAGGIASGYTLIAPPATDTLFYYFNGTNQDWELDNSTKTSLISAISVKLRSDAISTAATTFTYSGTLLTLSTDVLVYIAHNYLLKASLTYPFTIAGSTPATSVSIANSTAFDSFMSTLQSFLQGIHNGVATTEATLSAMTMAELKTEYDSL